jgi:hypothetical protein
MTQERTIKSIFATIRRAYLSFVGIFRRWATVEHATQKEHDYTVFNLRKTVLDQLDVYFYERQQYQTNSQC